MKLKIVGAISEEKFSIQMDGTQDCSVVDQQTIILRYVKDEEEVKERLCGKKCRGFFWPGFVFHLLQTTLQENGLNWRKWSASPLTELLTCVGNTLGFKSLLRMLHRMHSQNEVSPADSCILD